jgi:hypothetical protein
MLNDNAYIFRFHEVVRVASEAGHRFACAVPLATNIVSIETGVWFIFPRFTLSFLISF